MSTSARQTYHHGDLRAALLDAADLLLEEGGSGAISLREAARRTGVSATASYRHFRNKEDLLAALAARGFAGLEAALRTAAAGREPLTAMGLAYIRFACERPGRFRLMFGGGLFDRDAYPELRMAADSAFRRLAVVAAGGSPPNPESRPAAIRAWSLVHGLATLILDGILPRDEATIAAVLRDGAPPRL